MCLLRWLGCRLKLSVRQKQYIGRFCQGFLPTEGFGLLDAAVEVVGEDAGPLGEIFGAEQIGFARFVGLLDEGANPIEIDFLLSVQ